MRKQLNKLTIRTYDRHAQFIHLNENYLRRNTIQWHVVYLLELRVTSARVINVVADQPHSFTIIGEQRN